MTDVPRPTTERGTWRRLAPQAGRLLLELLVVFVGVYAAFALAQHQAQQDERDRAAALRRALAAELALVVEAGEAGAQEIAGLRRYAVSFDDGSRPPLQPLDTNVPFSPDVWEAALASGGVELLDPDLLVRLSSFYGSVRLTLQQVDQADAYTRTLLLPNVDRPASEFYDETGRLRPKYGWYRRHVVRLATRVPALAAEADTLRTELLRE